MTVRHEFRVIWRRESWARTEPNSRCYQRRHDAVRYAARLRADAALDVAIEVREVGAWSDAERISMYDAARRNW